MCLTASQAPIQQEGYAAGAPLYEGGEPVFIVECSSVLTCPGSLELGKCPGSNSGIACVDCLPDHYQAVGWDDGLEFTIEGCLFWVLNVSNCIVYFFAPSRSQRFGFNFCLGKFISPLLAGNTI